MEHFFLLAALWMGMALLATFLGSLFRISNALLEITVGLVADAVASRFFEPGALGSSEPWLLFICGTGAVMLTFLAGAELEPAMMRERWKEVSLVGLLSFLLPFLACMALSRFVLGWSAPASWLAGIALSTTSMAVVYTVMLETGLNRTEYGKGILGACFVTDLATVIALGLMFSPFSWKTAVFLIGCFLALVALPGLTMRLSNHYSNRTSAFRTKWVLFVLFGLGGLAAWSGSEPVLPAYLAGMMLSREFSQDQSFIRRLRTLTIGFLSPFYFLRAGSLVSLPALSAALPAFLVLLGGKVAAKVLGVLPAVSVFRKERRERWYYTLLMSTGLTFGTISALFGLQRGIVNPEQYSLLVAVVIGSAVVPTMAAGAWFIPRNLLNPDIRQSIEAEQAAVRARRQSGGMEPREEG